MCQPGQALNKNWGQGQLCKRVRNFRYCFGQHNLAVAGHKSSFYGSNNYVNNLNLYIPLRLHVLNFLDRLFVLWKGCNNRISSGKRWMKYCIFSWSASKIFIYSIFLTIVPFNIWVWWMTSSAIVNYMVISRSLLHRCCFYQVKSNNK